MKYRSYNRELRTSTAQLLDVFSSVVIDRRDNQNNIQKLINVSCVYGNRSRILKSLENRNKTLKLPLISISMGNLSRDGSRVHDTHNGIINQRQEWKFNPIYNTPVPINIEYEMTIVTKLHEDMDQIISNFIPFTNPDFYVVWPNPKNPAINLKSQIVWNTDMNIQFPNEITENDPYRFTATTTFTYKTWMFPGLDAISNNDGPLIHRINFCPNLLSIEDGNYMLDRWYDVPTCMSFDSFQQSVVCGLIKTDNDRDNWDFLPMSGGISGYWSDVSANVSGMVLGTEISGDPTYLVTDEGDLLLINNIGYLPAGMSELDYYQYYLDTISGDLSACF